MLHSRSERVTQNLLDRRDIYHQGFAVAPIAARMEALQVPGISIAVIHNFQIDWAAGYGVREAGTGTPVTPGTLFQACSISKPVTAVAVLRLVEQGVLNLDEDVNRYLTSWRVPANGAWQPRITLRQLLSHSAGTTVHGFPGYSRHARIPTRQQILNGEAPANTWPVLVNVLPGTRFRYSGGGTTVVEQVLVDVMQRPFPDVMHELVLAPLGMSQSTFAQPLPAVRSDEAASGHTLGGGHLDGKWNVHPEMAAAGLWTTPSDLARLVIDIQAAHAGRPGTLLSQALVREMLTPQAGGFGLGFSLDGARFNHGGDNVGFKAALVAYREEPLGVIVMANSDNGASLNNEVIRSVAREYQWPLDPARDFPFYPGTDPEPVQVDAAQLTHYAGAYALWEGYTLRLWADEGALWMQAPDQQPLPLKMDGNGTFFTDVLNVTLQFPAEGESPATGCTLSVGGQSFTAKRI